MTRRFVAVALLAGGLALACSDSAGPPPNHELPQPTVSADMFRPLQWQATDGAPCFTAVGAAPDGEVQSALNGEIFASPNIPPPPIEQYQVSFWVVAGEDRNVKIDYLDVDKAKPFVHFRVSPGALARWPDGTKFADGDSVLITVRVDTAAMAVYFEPSGLQFSKNEPARLRMWYAAMNGDLDGNGVVDEEDAYIERRLLGVFHQSAPGEDWERIRAKHAIEEDWFRVKVGHFSGFAVAY